MSVKSGIQGLDELLEGGFPEGTVNLVCGPAGSAKSLFAMQFLRGCSKGERGALISLEESRENVIRASKGFGLGLADLEAQDELVILDLGAVRGGAGNDGAEKEVVDFAAILDAVEGLQRERGITRLAVDSLSAVALYYPSVDLYRRELFRFCRGLKALGVTALLISEASHSGQPAANVEQFVTDSMIFLGYENIKGEYRRTLTVYKMRFTRHDPYKHPFFITPKGIEVDQEEVIF